MRVLLLGAGGMLARDLEAAAPRDVQVVPCTHAQLDVTDDRALEQAVLRSRPDVVVNAAAYNDVEEAETNSALAWAVNGAAPGVVGRAAAAVGARVVHYSTDFVFDGENRTPYREDAAAHPVNLYGKSKLQGEVNLRQSGAEHLIIRTQWLFGRDGHSFPRTMWERAVQRLPTRVVSDQTGRPTYTGHLAQVTWKLIAADVTGIVHVANAGVATWYDVAKRVFHAAGADDLVTPCTTAEYPTRARRPAWSVLDTSRAEAILGGPLPHWETGLGEFLRAQSTEQGAQSSS